MPRRLMFIACTLLAAGLCTGALAQSGEKPANKPAAGGTAKKPPAAGQPDPNLLAGPSVEQEATDQPPGRLGNPNNPGRPLQRPDMPARQWFNTVRELNLSQEQRDKFQAIVAEFQDAMREFQQAHADEMREVQEALRTARESGKEPEAKVRETAQKLEAENPKPNDYQKRIWDLLTAEQQETMRQKLAEMQKQMEQQRRAGRDGERRRSAESAGDQPGKAPAKGGDDQMMTGGATDKKPSNAAKPSAQAGKPPAQAAKPPADEANDQMSGSAGAGAAASPDRPNVRERLRERRRAAADGPGMEGLDDMARARTQFLLARQAPDRAGAPPTEQDKTFKFNEGGEK